MKCDGIRIPVDDVTCLFKLQFADDHIVNTGDKVDLEYSHANLRHLSSIETNPIDRKVEND